MLKLFRFLLAAAVTGVAPLSGAVEADPEVPRELTALSAAEVARLNGQLRAGEDYDIPPQVVRAYVPVYPASRLLAGTSGQCSVAITIEVDGRAADPSPDPDADPKMCAHAVFALAHWRFEPASRSGRPVTSRIRLPFHYNIDR